MLERTERSANAEGLKQSKSRRAADKRTQDQKEKKKKHLVPTKQNRKAIVPHHNYIQQALRKKERKKERIFHQVPESLEVPHQDCCKEQHDIHAWSSQSSWEMQPEEAPAHRQNGKAEEPKRPACSLQPTRSENRRRRKSIAKNKRRQVSKCTGGREQKKIIVFFQEKQSSSVRWRWTQTNTHKSSATKNTQAKHKACMGLRLS